MPSRGRESRFADLASHRSGLPGVPRELLLRAFTTDRGDPYARWDAAKVEGRDSRRAPARRAAGERFLSRTGAPGCSGTCWRCGRPATTSWCASGSVGPLGMRSTGLALEPLHPGPHTGSKPTGPWHLAALAGAGGLRSTAPGPPRLPPASCGRQVPGPLGEAVREMRRTHPAGPRSRRTRLDDLPAVSAPPARAADARGRNGPASAPSRECCPMRTSRWWCSPRLSSAASAAPGGACCARWRPPADPGCRWPTRPPRRRARRGGPGP